MTRPTRRLSQPVFLSKSSVSSGCYSFRFILTSLLRRLIGMLQKIRNCHCREDPANKASHAWRKHKTKFASGLLDNFAAACRFFVFRKRRAQWRSHPILGDETSQLMSRYAHQKEIGDRNFFREITTRILRRKKHGRKGCVVNSY